MASWLLARLRASLVLLAFLSAISEAQRLQRLASAPLDQYAVVVARYAPALMLANGGLAIATQDQQVVFYDSTARVTRVFGRSGRGPGEFVRIYSLGSDADTVLVLDAMLRRITALSPSGGHSVHPMQSPSQAGPAVEPIAFAGATLLSLIPTPAATAGQGAQSAVVIRSGWRSSASDTIGRVDLRGARMLLRGPNDTRIVTAQPFVSGDHVAVDPKNGFVAVVRPPRTSTNPSDEIVVDVLGGGRRRSSRVPAARVPLTDRQVTAWLDSSAARYASRLGGEAAARRTLREQLIVPATQPEVVGALVGSDGAVWLRGSSVDGRLHRWWVRRSDGVSEFRIDLPANCTPLAVTSTGFWAVEETPDGEQLLVRYRILAR